MRVGVLILLKVLCLYAFQFSPAYDVRIGDVDIERIWMKIRIEENLFITSYRCKRVVFNIGENVCLFIIYSMIADHIIIKSNIIL